MPSRESASESRGRPMTAWHAVFLLVGVALFAWRASPVLTEPYVLNYTEGISLLAGERVLAGEPLYPPIQDPPFYYVAYPPLYPLLCAGITAITGPELWGLRTLSLLCELLLCWLSFALVRRGGGGRGDAAFATSMLLVLFANFKFHGLARLDALHVLISMVGVYGVLTFDRTGDRRGLAAAVLAFPASLLIKPTGVVPMVVVAAWSIVTHWRGRRSAREVLASVAAAFGLYLFAVIALVGFTGGEFWNHTVAYQGLSGYQASPVVLGRFAAGYFPLLAAGIPVLAWVRGASLLRWVAFGSLGWFAVSALKAGADLNYAFDPFVLLAVCIAIVWGSRTWLRGLSPRGDTLVQAAFLAVLALTGSPLREVLATDARADRRAIDDHVRKHDGAVVAEEPFFAVRHGKPVVLSDPFQFGVLARRGEFDPRPLLAMMRRGEIGLVLQGNRLRNVPGVPEVLAESYRRAYRSSTPFAETRWEVWVWTGSGETDSP